MKIIGKQVDRSELLWRDPDAGGIAPGVEFGVHPQTGRRCGVGSQCDNHAVTGQRLPPPVGRNLAEQAMLNLVSFTSARGEMAYSDDRSQFIRQLLQRHFPQPAPTAITAAAIRPRFGHRNAAAIRLLCQCATRLFYWCRTQDHPRTPYIHNKRERHTRHATYPTSESVFWCRANLPGGQKRSTPLLASASVSP